MCFFLCVRRGGGGWRFGQTLASGFAEGELSGAFDGLFVAAAVVEDVVVVAHFFFLSFSFIRSSQISLPCLILFFVVIQFLILRCGSRVG